jgi:hypothetical protein
MMEERVCATPVHLDRRCVYVFRRRGRVVETRILSTPKCYKSPSPGTQRLFVYALVTRFVFSASGDHTYHANLARTIIVIITVAM